MFRSLSVANEFTSVTVGPALHDRVMRSIELFATEVAPVARGEIGRRAPEAVAWFGKRGRLVVRSTAQPDGAAAAVAEASSLGSHSR